MSDPSPQSALYLALAEAIADIEGVAKRGNGQGYKYAKADHVVAEADRVLTKRGVSVFPGSSEILVAGVAEGKSGPRTIFVLHQEFVIVHRDGGEARGSVSVGIGTNLNTGPTQATMSAFTAAEAYFYKAMLRMPRVDEDDHDHPKNNRREEEERPPARPTVTVPQTRKAITVLRAIAAAKNSTELDMLREKWNDVLARRGGPEGDCGYSDDEAKQIGAAIETAEERTS